MKDINLKCQAKIKSISQYAIKGKRLFPTQVVKNDSNRSINVQHNLSNSSYTSNNSTFTFESQSGYSRFTNRHSTEIPGSKFANLRLSLEHISQNKSSQAYDSGNHSDLISGIQVQSDIKAEKSGLDQSESSNYKKLLIDNKQFNIYKDLQIQKITSNQTKMDPSQQDIYSKNSAQIQNKNIKQNSMKQILQGQATATHDNMWQLLYLQYKQKYAYIQKSNKQLIIILQDSQYSIQILRQQKQVILKNCHNFQLKIEEQQKKITKLEQSIKINRNINQQLMKKERQTEKQMKLIEKSNETILKKQQQNLKAQFFLEISSRFEEDKIFYQKQIFQLKLKLIDQVNQFQQSNKTKQTIKLNLQHQITKLSSQIQLVTKQKSDLLAKIIVLSQQISSKYVQIAQINKQNLHLKTCIQQLNEQIQRRTCQIVRIDQQNLRLDQEKVRISDQYHNISIISNDQIIQLSNRCQSLQRQRQQLIDTLQNRDGQLAQANITKNSGLIQILQLKKKLQDKQEIKQISKQLIIKNLEIVKLKEKIRQSYTQIQKLIYQNEEVKSYTSKLKEQYQQQYTTKWKENQQLMGQNLLFKLQILQQLKQSSQEIKVLRQKLSIQQKSKEEFRIINIQISSQKAMMEELLGQKSQIIVKLNIQINQLLKNQIEKSELQDKQKELKQIQQQYLELIEGELKKIRLINDNQWQSIENHSEDRFFSTPIKCRRQKDQLQEGLQPGRTPQKEQQQIPLKKYEFQSEIDELKIRIQELTFVNEALQNKVESFNEIQEESSKEILDKIKKFQENLEKSLNQKNQIEINNSQLQTRIVQLSEKCLCYESRIQQLENIYRQLQANHFQTQQELLKSNIQYVNLKLMKKIAQQEGNINQNDEFQAQNTELQKFRSEDMLQTVQIHSQITTFDKLNVKEQKQIAPQNVTLSRQDLTKMQRQDLQKEIVQNYIANESHQVNNFVDQLLLQSIHNQIPQICINILALYSDDEDNCEKQCPLINVITVNSSIESYRQQEIEEKFTQQSQIEYNQLIEEPGYQQLDSQKHNKQLSNEGSNQKKENYSLTFEALIKDIIERAQRNQSLQKIQQDKVQNSEIFQKQINVIDEQVTEKENQLDFVQ